MDFKNYMIAEPWKTNHLDKERVAYIWT